MIFVARQKTRTLSEKGGKYYEKHKKAYPSLFCSPYDDNDRLRSSEQ